MGVFSHSKNRGQASLPDLLLATFLFFILLGGLVYYSNKLQEDAQTITIRRSLDAVSSNLAEFLIKNPGTPYNWESLPDINQTQQMGLAQKDRVLDPLKVLAFVNHGNTDYTAAKSHLNLQYYDFYAQFSGGALLTTGIPPLPNKNASVVQRIVTINGIETQFTLTIYAP